MEVNDKVEELGKELATKIQIPKDVKEKIYAKIFKEIGMAILIFLYFLLLNLGYVKLEKEVFNEDLHNFAGILIMSTVIVFEIAYKKDNGEIALHGVELLVLSIITLFMPYIYFYRGITLKFLYSFSSMYIAIYYAIKSLVVYEREIKKYKDSLSDVKEIVEKSEKSYLDEKNERKFKDDGIDDLVEKNKNLRLRVERVIRQNRKKSSKNCEEKLTKDNNSEKLNEEEKIVKNEIAEKPKKTRARKKSDESKEKDTTQNEVKTQETSKKKTTRKTNSTKDKIEEDIKEPKKKSTKKTEEKTDEKNEKQPVRRKRGRPRKNEVKSMATSRKNNDVNGEK